MVGLMDGFTLGLNVGLKVGLKVGFCDGAVAFAKLRRQRTTRMKISFIYGPEEEEYDNTNKRIFEVVNQLTFCIIQDIC
jgi:hypothetical protein